MNPPISQKLLLTAGAILFIWLAARFFLPILMPFVWAGVLALCAEPLVSVLQKRLRLPRSGAAAIGVIIALVIGALVIITLLGLLIRQLGQLGQILPDLEEAAVNGLESLEGYLVSLAHKAPGATGEMLTGSVENFFSDGTALVNQVTARLLSTVTNVVTRIPDSALGFATWLLASFMISAKLPAIRQWLKQQLSKERQQQLFGGLGQLKKNIWGWFSAQLKLITITFLILTAGFLLLQIQYAPLWAALISLVDAMPVLGTGTVLLPWSLVCFLQGETVRGIGLLGIYAAAWLLRSVLEPKLIGKQLGLDPLVTLVAMYTGYQLWGFLGMIFSPLLAVTAIQVYTAAKTN